VGITVSGGRLEMGRNCARSASAAINAPQADAARIFTKIFDISDWHFFRRARSSVVIFTRLLRASLTHDVQEWGYRRAHFPTLFITKEGAACLMF
jgi:hypothetical protein